MLHCVIFLKTCNPKTSMSPSHHNFFVRHINISSGANHTFGASLTYFLPPFGCRQLPARTLHFNQPLLRTVHYFCYFIFGSITSTTSPDISLFSATSIDVTQLPTLHLWFQKRGGLQTSRSIVPTKNDLEISICDSDFWSSSMSSDSIIRFGTI